MKLQKKDMGKWDKEELSIIVKGYTAKQIADHILKNQQVVDRLHMEIQSLKSKREENKELQKILQEIFYKVYDSYESTKSEIKSLKSENENFVYDLDETGKTIKSLKSQLEKYQKIVDRLHEQIKNIPDCFSKECMGCEFDLQRHILNKILEGKKYS